MRSLTLAIFGTVTLLNAAAALGDTITLKSSARPAPDATNVKLADIADLEGPDAQALGAVVIAKAGPAAVELSIRDVRAKLDEAGANWAKINLCGRMVTVRPARGNDGGAPPLAMVPVSIEGKAAASLKPVAAPAKQREMPATALVKAPTLRGTIANLIISTTRRQPTELKFAFDVSDDDLLDTRNDAARFEIAPVSTLAGDTVVLTIRKWEGDVVTQSRDVSVHPLMRVKASVLKHDIRKDQVVGESDVESSEQWMPLGQALQNPDRISAVGRVTNKNLKAGETLRDAHVRRTNLVKRGDQVMVRCLVGGVAVSLQAEARAEGGEGDTIEFRKAGEKQTFLATVTSRGEAVVDLAKK